MSPDLIKNREFRGLYEPAVDEERGAPLRARRFESNRVRFRELLDRLAAAEDRERRVVDAAVAEARESALADARAEYGIAADAFRAVASELHETISTRTEIARAEIVDLALAVAGKVLRREIRRDDDFVVRLVERCLHRIVERSSVRIRVHPGDHDRVAVQLEELAGEVGAPHEITVVKDQRVDRGGCIVETPDFVVDGTIRTQIATARQALRGDDS